MGTRTNIHFSHGETLCANIYQHSDGYPGEVENGEAVEGGVLADLLKFFRLLKAEVNDARFYDAEHLAGKFLVWKSQELKKYAVRCEYNDDHEYLPVEPTHYLQFLGVSPCLDDHGDIQYVYEVDCNEFDDEGFPTVRWREATPFPATEERSLWKTVFLGTKAPAAASLEFDPVQTDKHTVRLATVSLPDSPNQEEGWTNELQIAVSYYKEGTNRQGRGFYLVVMGCTTKDLVETHALFADPCTYVLVESTKRFSAKTLTRLATSVPADHLDKIERLVEDARTYYASKGKAA